MCDVFDFNFYFFGRDFAIFNTFRAEPAKKNLQNIRKKYKFNKIKMVFLILSSQVTVV